MLILRECSGPCSILDCVFIVCFVVVKKQEEEEEEKSNVKLIIQNANILC